MDSLNSYPKNLKRKSFYEIESESVKKKQKLQASTSIIKNYNDDDTFTEKSKYKLKIEFKSFLESTSPYKLTKFLKTFSDNNIILKKLAKYTLQLRSNTTHQEACCQSLYQLTSSNNKIASFIFKNGGVSAFLSFIPSEKETTIKYALKGLGTLLPLMKSKGFNETIKYRNILNIYFKYLEHYSRDIQIASFFV